VKNKTLLWLDDIRDPNKADWLLQYAPEFMYDQEQVVWVKNYDQFTAWILENGLPHTIAFDHDLGEDVARDKVANGASKRQARAQKRETMSGYDCAKWLVEYCMDNKVLLPNWTIQSANPVGKENINALLNNYFNKYERIREV